MKKQTIIADTSRIRQCVHKTILQDKESLYTAQNAKITLITKTAMSKGT